MPELREEGASQRMALVACPLSEYDRRRKSRSRLAVGPEGADHRADGGGAGLAEEAGEVGDEALGAGGIVERGGADLNGGGAGDEEFQGVLGGADAADAEDGQIGQRAG